MNEGIYDYCSAIINWDDGGQRTRKQFRYYNIWSLAPEFKKRVEDSWRKPIRGTSMYQLVGKLNRLKIVFKDLNMSKLSNVELKTDVYGGSDRMPGRNAAGPYKNEVKCNDPNFPS